MSDGLLQCIVACTPIFGWAVVSYQQKTMLDRQDTRVEVFLIVESIKHLLDKTVEYYSESKGSREQIAYQLNITVNRIEYLNKKLSKQGKGDGSDLIKGIVTLRKSVTNHLYSQTGEAKKKSIKNSMRDGNHLSSLLISCYYQAYP